VKVSVDHEDSDRKTEQKQGSPTIHEFKRLVQLPAVIDALRNGGQPHLATYIELEAEGTNRFNDELKITFQPAAACAPS
jgi:hypothetical protein